MYRGITLSKLFEAILLVVYENSLYSDPLKFAFKNASCSHALFGFTETASIIISVAIKYSVPFWMLVRHLIKFY